MVDESWRTLLHDVGAWMVPTFSVDSSGFVPIKSKFRHRTVRPSACSPRIASCLLSATADGNIGRRQERDEMKRLEKNPKSKQYIK